MNDVLYRTLPNSLSESQASNKDSSIHSFIKTSLPRGDVKDVERELHWQFLLDKHSSYDKKPRKIRKKKTFLTRKERKSLDILKLPKEKWDYAALEPMRVMWQQYMRQHLDLLDHVPTCEDQDWANFATILARSELIGSEMKVVRSKAPNFVGISGTVVLETKMTFQVVTKCSKLKILPKAQSVFEFYLDELKFTVFGKHIMTKPSERSVKKMKSHMMPDL